MKNSPPSNKSRIYPYSTWTISIRALPAAAIDGRDRHGAPFWVSWHVEFLRRLCTRKITPYRLKAPKQSASDATRGATHTWKNRAGPNWHRIGTARTTHVRECNDSLSDIQRTHPPATIKSFDVMAQWWRWCDLWHASLVVIRGIVLFTWTWKDFKNDLDARTTIYFWDKLPPTKKNDDFAHGAGHDEWTIPSFKTRHLCCTSRTAPCTTATTKKTMKL
jgi:hypothetical protein